MLLNLPLFSDALLDTLSKKLPGKSFISLGIVQQISNNYHNSQALNLSYSFTHQKRFGIELGYTQSIDEAEHKQLTSTKDFSSISLLSNYLFVLDKHIGIKAKVGYAKNKNADDGLSYGAELIFQITKTTGLSMSYQQMNKDMKYLMINTVYRLKH
jgi:hypothetical protein